MATFKNGMGFDTADLLNALLGSNNERYALTTFSKPATEVKKPENALERAMSETLSAMNMIDKKKATPVVKNIIYNPPATIVTWEDGTKTVVKCDDKDKFSKEFGLAMAFMSKIFGSRCAFKRLIETAYCPQEKKAAAEAKKIENTKRPEIPQPVLDGSMYATSSSTVCSDGCDAVGYNSPNAFQK
jgi:hypothetical protein